MKTIKKIEISDCPCGKQHILDLADFSHYFVWKMMKKQGKFVRIKIIEDISKEYLMPRYYPVFHRVRGHKLGSYGFKQV